MGTPSSHPTRPNVVHRFDKIGVAGSVLFVIALFIWCCIVPKFYPGHVNTGFAIQVLGTMLVLVFSFSAVWRFSRTYNLLHTMLGFFLVFLIAHHFGFWCYTHPANKAVMCQTLRNIQDFCKTNGIQYALSAGSLLGAIRDYPENGVGIPYEKDEDILIDEAKREIAEDHINHMKNRSTYWFVSATEARVDVQWRSFSPNSTTTVPYCGGNLSIQKSYMQELDSIKPDWHTRVKVPRRIGISRVVGCFIVVDWWINHPLDIWVTRVMLATGIPYFLGVFILKGAVPQHVYEKCDGAVTEP